VLGTATAEIHSQYLSSRKAKDVLGWTPSNDLRSGLAESINWYRDFLEAKSDV